MSAGNQLLHGDELCSEQGMVLGENWKNVILFGGVIPTDLQGATL